MGQVPPSIVPTVTPRGPPAPPTGLDPVTELPRPVAPRILVPVEPPRPPPPVDPFLPDEAAGKLHPVPQPPQPPQPRRNGAKKSRKQLDGASCCFFCCVPSKDPRESPPDGGDFTPRASPSRRDPEPDLSLSPHRKPWADKAAGWDPPPGGVPTMGAEVVRI